MATRRTIGRHADSTIVVDDPRVSRRHAAVRPVTGGHLVVDLGSTNGTTVNGQPIDEQTLQPGDEIQVGETTLRYEVD